MEEEYRVVSTFKSGWKRQGEWTNPRAARQIFEEARCWALADVIAIDLERRRGRHVRLVLRYERVVDGPLEHLSPDQLERLDRGGRRRESALKALGQVEAELFGRLGLAGASDVGPGTAQADVACRSGRDTELAAKGLVRPAFST
jgi:hypothetical protein